MVSQMETRTERKVDRKSVIDGWMGKNEPVGRGKRDGEKVDE